LATTGTSDSDSNGNIMIMQLTNVHFSQGSKLAYCLHDVNRLEIDSFPTEASSSLAVAERYINIAKAYCYNEYAPFDTVNSLNRPS